MEKQQRFQQYQDGMITLGELIITVHYMYNGDEEMLKDILSENLNKAEYIAALRFINEG